MKPFPYQISFFFFSTIFLPETLNSCFSAEIIGWIYLEEKMLWQRLISFLSDF